MKSIADIVTNWNCKHPALFTSFDWFINVVLVVMTLAFLMSIGSGNVYGQKPQIFVDNVNGASLASGSPEAIGPISALATCHTNGVSSATIQWPANGLSGAGVPTDGSAILFIDTASGRKFSRITGLAAGTVTVANNFNITLAGARDCGVGGRLLNISTQLALDMLGGNNQGYQIQLVATGVNYIWTATRDSSSSTAGCGFFGVKNSGVRPIVDCNFQPGTCLNAGSCDVEGIQFRNTNVVKTGTVGIDVASIEHLQDIIIGGDDATTSWAIGATGAGSSSVAGLIVSSLIQNNIIGLQWVGTDFSLGLLGNVFRLNETAILANGSTQNSMLAMMNIFWENVVAIELGNNDYNYYNAIVLNTFHDNGTAVSITDPGGLFNLLFASNLITNNTLGVGYTGAARNIERESSMVDFNCYGLGGAANGANVSGFILGPNTININPLYVNVATGDFTPSVTNFTIQAWPPGLNQTYIGTLTESLVSCGAIQPAGGTGAFSNVGI